MGTKALYCTTDSVGGGTGGGQVVEHEIAVLRGMFDEVTILSRANLTPAAYANVDIPFLQDHFALSLLDDDFAKFDYAHFYSGTFTETVRMLKRRGTKVGYTCPAHDMQVSIAAFKRRYGNYPYPHLEDQELFRRFTEGLRLADGVLVPSTLSQGYLKSIGVQRTYVLPHGHVPPARKGRVEGRYSFGYLGQVGPDKDVETLIKAFGLLQGSALWTKPTRLVLAGSGTEGLGATVQRFVGSGEVMLLGYVLDKQAFWDAVDIYVQPSVTESFGIEVLEARSAGKYLLVSDGVGAKDFLGWEARVFLRGQPGCLAVKMEEACSQLDTTDIDGRLEQSSRVSALLSWAEVERRFEEWIRWLLSNPPHMSSRSSPAHV